MGKAPGLCGGVEAVKGGGAQLAKESLGYDRIIKNVIFF